ncbi:MULTISPECIES: CopG family antitoxin [Halobacteriovorax]|nr:MULTISPECIES: CopG family antitoxin [Halobacteriovorax]
MNKKLSKKEKTIADNFAAGDFKKASDHRDFKEIAKKTKAARINLRLEQEVLNYFQKEADRQGIPYQTLINSTLYKVAKGELVDNEIVNFGKELKEIKKEILKINRKKRA